MLPNGENVPQFGTDGEFLQGGRKKCQGLLLDAIKAKDLFNIYMNKQAV